VVKIQRGVQRVALRITGVLQNFEKNPRCAPFFFGTSQSRSALADILRNQNNTENRERKKGKISDY
jgi:hypothetical protein